MPSFSHLHNLNIIVHVATGGLAVALCLLILLRRKGDDAHRRAGRIALSIAGLSVAAALLGAFVFTGKYDLMGVSLLVAYHLWAGLRALRLQNRGRGWADLGPAVLMVAGGAALIVLYRTTDTFNWGPAQVYAAAGGMLFYGGWDVLRTRLPLRWRLWLNPAEHAFRMTSITGAFLSVAAATLLKSGSAYVPLGISAVFAVIAVFLAARYALGVMPSAARKARLNTESEL